MSLPRFCSQTPWLLTIFIVASACGESRARDGGTAFDAAALDAEVTSDSGTFDASSHDAEPNDASTTDGPVTMDSGQSTSVYGFEIRKPEYRTVPCSGCQMSTYEGRDMDYVCTLSWGQWPSHYVYAQAHAVQYVDFMGFIYAVDGAWLSDGTQIQPVTATYDWGGNHHNDTLTVDLGAQVLRYNHSSFGYGFRQCQPMDCLEAYEPGPGALVEDGCTRDRTIPVVCKLVTDTGTVPPMLDTFRRCPGDT